MSASSRPESRSAHTRRRTGLLALFVLTPACAKVEAVEPPAPPAAAPKPRVEPALATQAEHYERAKREITPERFDAELEKLKREIVVDEPAGGRRKRK